MHKLIALATLAMITTGMGGVANAGEVTGGPNPKPTGIRGNAQSICAFSGQEDGLALVRFENGVPIFQVVETGPGLVQTPSHETSPGYFHEPGIPGTACRGN